MVTLRIRSQLLPHFLAQQENHFILNMGFMGTGVHSQVKCEWQSEEKDEIIPDFFFVVRANGYADIVEFKLPKVKKEIL